MPRSRTDIGVSTIAFLSTVFSFTLLMHQISSSARRGRIAITYPQQTHIGYIANSDVPLSAILTNFVLLMYTICFLRLFRRTTRHYEPDRVDTREYGPESSMRPLEAFETDALNRAMSEFNVYELIEANKEDILKIVREDIIIRYKENPATFKSHGKTYVLPLEWEDFQKRNFSPKNYQKALRAYYKNEIHSTYRFISPNPWLSPDAVYAMPSPNNPTVKISCYQRYSKEILTCFLVAQELLKKDSESEPRVYLNTEEINGNKIPNAGSNNYHPFYSTFALMGRAHNWDKGATIENGVRVEKDDFNVGDDPTCPLGMKRRMYIIISQYYQILNLELLEQALNSFVLNYYKEKITPAEAKTLLNIYERLIGLEEISPADYEKLSVQDIPNDEINHFITKLEEERNLLPDPIKEHIIKLFELKNPKVFQKIEPFNCFHLLKFQNLYEMLEKKVSILEETTELKGLTQFNLFSNSKVSPDQSLEIVASENIDENQISKPQG